MINSDLATEIALNDTSQHYLDWKIVNVAVLRCELVNNFWCVDVRRVYSHGDCVIFPCEISLDGSTNGYSFDFVDLPPEFQHLEPVEELEE